MLLFWSSAIVLAACAAGGNCSSQAIGWFANALWAASTVVVPRSIASYTPTFKLLNVYMALSFVPLELWAGGARSARRC